MWHNAIMLLYPDALHHTYCMPPEHFDRVPYIRDTVPSTGQSALVLCSQPAGAAPVFSILPASQCPYPPAQYSLWTQESQPQATPVQVQESDYKDDFVQQHLLANLQALGNASQEPMFIVSQLNFGDYLSEPSYTAAVKASQLPKPPWPEDLGKKYTAGDFDILLIHHYHGILVGKLKSVGRNQPGVSRTPAQADYDVAKRVGKAFKQLDKSETLVSYIAPCMTVRKTLFLLSVNSAQLQAVLIADPLLEQAACRCLGASNATGAKQLSCCSDQLSDPATYWDVAPAILSQLTSWWQHRVTCTLDANLTDDLYLDIVARFVGPATLVNIHCNIPPRMEVRMEGEAVAEMGGRLACLGLTLQQLDVVHRSLPRVFLTGPPGTGKTLLLVLQGQDVDIISGSSNSLAASLMMQHQLQVTLHADPTASPAPGTVWLRQYDFGDDSDVDTAVSNLSSVVCGGTLCVLVDEMMTNACLSVSRCVSQMVK